MILLSVDPHKSTHTATALDPTANRPISTIRIEATLGSPTNGATRDCFKPVDRHRGTPGSVEAPSDPERFTEDRPASEVRAGTEAETWQPRNRP